jgi:hypothetical protein
MNSHNREFYLTPQRILDVDIVGDVQYETAADRKGHSKLRIEFTNAGKKWIELYADEADTAWKNYQTALDPWFGV